MKNKAGKIGKVCGNCRYHNTYEYPDTIFCFAKFQKLENPVLSILESCSEWEQQTQDCFCLEDSKKKTIKKKTG